MDACAGNTGVLHTLVTNRGSTTGRGRCFGRLVGIRSRHVRCLSSLGGLIGESTAGNSVVKVGTRSCFAVNKRSVGRTCGVFGRTVRLRGRGSSCFMLRRFVSTTTHGVGDSRTCGRRFVRSCLFTSKITSKTLGTTAGRGSGGLLGITGSGVSTFFVGDNMTAYSGLRTVCTPGIRRGGAGLSCLGRIVSMVRVLGYARRRTCFTTSRTTRTVRPATRATMNYKCVCCGGNSVSGYVSCFSRTVGLRRSPLGGTSCTCGATTVLFDGGRLDGTGRCTLGSVSLSKGGNGPCVLVTGVCTSDPG